ncbi:flagellar hook-associated protein FlgK [Criibacterium bergeronii]|uniref:Flagellar hook-associated protein 1 n=1 Tax=Criibacterium bergeronii TaxID=1871336 RepID=A0A371IK59_9FIRM|nr:flagellar hook-associated protein FlgK [Criibacterium bergeronii]MBS6062875.1 flagellar hook-associated protein FlgK [Peptostreptococcaceae bacterium]RDY20875.1 flagellar hook-associated protein FlgK [Criibacterium bergeronii]
MRSTFSGFNAAVSGLFAAQRAMDVLGHNIANIDTEGYTRQRSDQVNATPTYDGTSGWLGTGVRMKYIKQIRDELIDIRYRAKLSTKEYWSETSASLRNLENIFAEPSDKGITSIIDNFFNAIDAVIKHPENNTTRSNFITTAITMTNYFNSLSEKLETAVKDLDKDANAMVTDLNSMFHQVATLNQEIFISESDGSMANDLRDRRNNLVDKISELVDVKVQKQVLKDSTGKPQETWNLIVDGHPVVMHNDVFEIKNAGKVTTDLNNVAQNYRTTTSSKDANGNALKEAKDKDGNLIKDAKGNQLYYEPTTDALGLQVTRFEFYDGQKVDMNNVGGRLGAALQQRDSVGDPSMNHKVKGVPFYIRATNEYMKAFAEEANRIHTSGIDANGEQGEPLFESFGQTMADGKPAPINAKNVRVNSHIVNSTAKLAIGLVKGKDGKADQSDQENFHRFFAMKESQLSVELNIVNPNALDAKGKSRMVTIGKGIPEDIIKSVVTSVLGVDAKEAKDTLKNATIEELELNMTRLSVSGVSENEELTNMLKFQHAYNASARMITTVDEMLDVIINRMGRVGL